MHSRPYFLLLLVTILAFIPRVYQLDRLSFFGDEETTALPSRSVAEGGAAEMPTGMPYHRALPQTWLNAISAKTLGVDNEMSYRLPAAIFGAFTIPLLFWLLRPISGTPIAFVAAAFLGFSEWHILVSREARMYAPFLFFYIAAAFSILYWTRYAKIWLLITSVTLTVVSVSFHALAFFLFSIPLAALLVPGWSRVSAGRMVLLAAAIAVLTRAYSSLIIERPINHWRHLASNGTTYTSGNDISLLSLIPPDVLPTIPFLAPLGIAFAAISFIHLFRIRQQNDFRANLVMSLTTLGAVVFALFGHLYAAFGALAISVVSNSDGLKAFFVKQRLTLFTALAIALGWILYAIAIQGEATALKQLVNFPFPYPLTFLSAFPLFTVLAAIGVFAILARKPCEICAWERVVILSAMLPLIGVGIVMKWAPLRYLIMGYPFIVILAAIAVVRMSYLLPRKLRHPAVAATVLSGIVSGHGLLPAFDSATIRHGNAIPGAPSTIYPDHRSAGVFVKSRIRTGDTVIAEDALQHGWYVGRVDYWLRDPAKSQKFLYKSADGEIRDIYVASRLATLPLLKSLERSNKRIWIITSAETINWQYYISSDQHRWLTSVSERETPVFTASDGATKVYCLHCDDI